MTHTHMTVVIRLRATSADFPQSGSGTDDLVYLVRTPTAVRWLFCYCFLRETALRHPVRGVLLRGKRTRRSPSVVGRGSCTTPACWAALAPTRFALRALDECAELIGPAGG